MRAPNAAAALPTTRFAQVAALESSRGGVFALLDEAGTLSRGLRLTGPGPASPGGAEAGDGGSDGSSGGGGGSSSGMSKRRGAGPFASALRREFGIRPAEAGSAPPTFGGSGNSSKFTGWDGVVGPPRNRRDLDRAFCVRHFAGAVEYQVRTQP